MSLGPLGPYVLLHRLAAGGMAEVFVAKRLGPLGFEKVLAIKRILPHLSHDQEFVHMFVDEARLAARLQHPNIVPVFDFGDFDGQLFLAMEYVRGHNVHSVLRAVAARGQGVDLGVALHIAICVLRALEHAHTATDGHGRSLGVVHRDVSPSNVLLSVQGEVKLSDFGIARFRGSHGSTSQGQLKGKLGYMSPEQVTGSAVDHRTDIFSVGIVLVEMLTGVPLFGGGSELDVLLRIRDGDLSRLRLREERVPEDVMDIARSMLARVPEDRVASAGQAADLLDGVLRRRGLHPRPQDVVRLQADLGLEPIPTPPLPVPEHAVSDMDQDRQEGVNPDEATPVGAILPSSFQAEPGPPDDAGRPTPVAVPASYKIKLPHGPTLGPVSFARTVELLTTARADGEALISVNDGTYVAAGEIPELRRFVTSPAFSWDTTEVRQATIRGRIGPRTIPELMFRLVEEGVTGVLHVRHGPRRKKVYLVGGRPEFVGSTDPRELLGEFLVASGQCMRMEVEMALAMLPRYGGRLGDVLVDMGILTAQQLQRCTAQQVRARFLELFNWRRGEYAFAYGATSKEKATPISADPRALLAEGVRACYHLSELEAMLESLMDKPLVPREKPVVDVRRFALPQSMAALLLDIDGRSTLGQVLAQNRTTGRADPEEIYQAVFLGLCCNIIEATS